MIKRTLQLGFLDGINKKFNISLGDPKEDLSKENVEDAMDTILEQNIFKSNDTDLAVKNEARIIETTVEVMEF